MSADLRQEVRHLRAQLAVAEAQLAMQGVTGFRAPAWMGALGPGRAAIVAALLEVHPRYLDAYTLEEVSRTRDRAAERDVNIVSVHICRIRERLGHDCIENLHGHGYRLSADFAGRLREEARAA